VNEFVPKVFYEHVYVTHKKKVDMTVLEKKKINDYLTSIFGESWIRKKEEQIRKTKEG
jgi:hypothetical protein